MAWLIGIDEAGYGPNLGPLIVAASAWWVEGEEKAEGGRRRAEGYAARVALLAPAARLREAHVCLYQRLGALVSRTACDNKLAIADSKQLYKPGHGLRQLERGVLVGLHASGIRRGGPANWGDLIAQHAPALPCYAEYNCALPIDATTDEITDLSTRFQAACVFAGVKLIDLRTRLVYPHEFNALTTHFGTKGAALSHVSIGLLRDTIDSLPPNPQSPTPSPLHVVCDKHGGRNRYAAILQHHFPDVWIDTLAESGPASRYAWGPPESRVDVCFRVKGEAELPVALASMNAKYHRELAMRAFNAFWCEQIPDLRPTAGYPTDAKRYKSAIATLQKELGIEDDVLWRWR